MSQSSAPIEVRSTTAVIGAGPAGLLFCIAARLLYEKRPGPPWQLLLFDKRTHYARTHRLRIGPEPYRDLAQALDDPRFDAILAFLEDERFKPEVNVLEARLSGLAAELGVRSEQLEIGVHPGMFTPTGLRDRLVADGRLQAGERFQLIAADSVHSVTRELAMPGVAPDEHTHQQLVRLQVAGPGLPAELGYADQYRWSKLLHSILDYRLNRNGFAEVDLFLDPREHQALSALHATPREPIPLTPKGLKTLSAPLFRRIARELGEGFGAGPCEVTLYSSFRLEHRVMPQRTGVVAGVGRVWLVGDAAVSLPFFRGMACLGQCVLALAEVQVAVAHGADVADQAAVYEARTARIIRAELAMVAARARLIRGGREFMRVSAMLPFPMQSWWLSMERPPPGRGRVSPGVVVNLALALPPAVIAVVAPLLDAHVWEPLGWLWLAALPLQAVGGVAYYAALAFEPPNRWLGWVWRGQILALMAAGVAVTSLNSWVLWRPAQLHSLVSWWVLGIAFVVGLVVFEWVQRRLWHRADLDAD